MEDIRRFFDVGKLERVLIHSPGKEIGKKLLSRHSDHLFKDVPEFEVLRQQHEVFLEKLESEGVETVQIRDILSQEDNRNRSLEELPNLMYTRDLAAVVGKDLLICNMKEDVRKKETEILEKAFLDFLEPESDFFKTGRSIEGGDIFLPSKDTIIIGNSLRTSKKAIKEFAISFFDSKRQIENIVVLDLHEKDRYIHLDMAFSQLDRKKFLVDEKAFKDSKITVLENSKNGLSVSNYRADFESLFGDIIGLDDYQVLGLNSEERKEQKTCGLNLLPIEESRVFGYRENSLINSKLRENGVEVIEVPGSELVKGNGGPRCMTMPLNIGA